MAIDLEHPHLSDAEQGVLVHELGRTSAYFELGMGGSSLLAVRAGVPEIVMVDSDAAWVASVRQHPEIAPRVADRSVMPIHADIGPVREWGTPADQTHVQNLPIGRLGRVGAARYPSGPCLCGRTVSSRLLLQHCVSLHAAAASRRDARHDARRKRGATALSGRVRVFRGNGQGGQPHFHETAIRYIGRLVHKQTPRTAV